jgi:hypothetical protein
MGSKGRLGCGNGGGGGGGGRRATVVDRAGGDGARPVARWPAISGSSGCKTDGRPEPALRQNWIGGRSGSWTCGDKERIVPNRKESALEHVGSTAARAIWQR